MGQFARFRCIGFWWAPLLASVMAAVPALPTALDLGAQSSSTVTGAAVARLSLIDGDVQVSTGGYHSETVDAVLNMPVGPGEMVRTAANADSEVEFPDGSVLRSAANSAATLIRLQPLTEIGLDDGPYYLELRAGGDPQFVVYAGDVTVEPVENASIRIRVENGQPEIAVMQGTVSVTRANSYTVEVQRGESLRTDAKDPRRYLLADSVGEESADRWNERRAQQVADSGADQTIARQDYAGDQGYGWSDLDSNGAWYPLPGEGLVWQPFGADADFDPYGSGNWVYAGYAGGGGYVWASGYSWGWLPFHCGSWGFYPGFGWGWVPAAGCRSYGGGWPVGGLPVNHPPHGWHGPLPVRPPATGGIVVRHPTLPGTPQHSAAHLVAEGTRKPRALDWNGVKLTPLMPIAPGALARGSSAVGSALRRDYPVQDGTHQPMLGRESTLTAVLPGRKPEWHASAAATGREPVTERVASGTAVAGKPGMAEGVAANGVPSASENGAALSASEPASGALVGGALVGGPVLTTGWHSRVADGSPVVNRSPGGAGPIVIRPTGIRPVPAGAGSVAPPGTRLPNVVPPVRPAPVVVAPTRVIMAPPAAVPRYTPPPAAPVFHSAPPPAAAPAASSTRSK